MNAIFVFLNRHRNKSRIPGPIFNPISDLIGSCNINLPIFFRPAHLLPAAPIGPMMYCTAQLSKPLLTWDFGTFVREKISSALSHASRQSYYLLGDLEA